MRNLSRTLATIFIFLAAVIWGMSFVTQRIAAEHMGAFTYNGIRFALGAISLLPLVRWGSRVRGSAEERDEQERVPYKSTLLVGLAGGGVLFIAANLQQFGILLSNSPSSASEAGFMTGMYIIFVPILGLALGRKASPLVWVGAVLAFGGLAVIGFDPSMAFQPSDLLLVLCAVFWAVHILLIDRYVNHINPIGFAVTQFAVCAVVCLACAFIFEEISVQSLYNALPVLLFGGIFVSAVAYTLQILGQQNVPPAIAAVIFSLEALFAAISEALFLGELMTVQKYIGGAVIIAGILLANVRRTGKTPLNY